MPCKHRYWFYPDREQIELCRKHYKAGIWCSNDLFKSRCPFREQADAKIAPQVVAPKVVDVVVETVDSNLEKTVVQIDPNPEATMPVDFVEERVEPTSEPPDPAKEEDIMVHKREHKKRGRPAGKK